MLLDMDTMKLEVAVKEDKSKAMSEGELRGPPPPRNRARWGRIAAHVKVGGGAGGCERPRHHWGPGKRMRMGHGCPGSTQARPHALGTPPMAARRCRRQLRHPVRPNRSSLDRWESVRVFGRRRPLLRPLY